MATGVGAGDEMRSGLLAFELLTLVGGCCMYAVGWRCSFWREALFGVASVSSSDIAVDTVLVAFASGLQYASRYLSVGIYDTARESSYAGALRA